MGHRWDDRSSRSATPTVREPVRGFRRLWTLDGVARFPRPRRLVWSELRSALATFAELHHAAVSSGASSVDALLLPTGGAPVPVLGQSRDSHELSRSDTLSGA
jgi:hypothetical protein